jgi:hypothetical protein
VKCADRQGEGFHSITSITNMIAPLRQPCPIGGGGALRCLAIT